MKYKCIIFDCDGVLVDSEEISINVLIEMANEVGADIGKEYAHSHFLGASLTTVFELIESLINKELPLTFESEFRTRSFEAFKSDLKPIKGIRELLNKISIPYCVASSGPVEKIRLNLTITELIENFEDRIFSCYDVGRWKPDPAIFIHAAKTMGFEPSECAVIEDSMPGLRAGIKGGFDVFGFATSKNQKDFEDEGAKVFFEMENLYEILTAEK